MIDKTSQKNKTPYLLVDSGNALFKSRSPKKITSEQITKAKGIANIYKSMKYDAVNVAPGDILNGLSFIHDLNSVPWISASFYDVNGSSLFNRYSIKKRESTRIAITGLTSAPSNINNKFIYKEWPETLPSLLEELAEKADFIVLLSALPQSENIKIAEKYPQIRLIITAHQSGRNTHPQIINNSIHFQTASRGKYLGYFSVTNPQQKLWHNYATQNRERLQQQLQTLDYRLNRLNSQKDKNEASQLSFQNLSVEKDKILEKIALLKTEKNSEGSTYTNNFFALDKNVSEDVKVNKLIESIKNDINANKAVSAKSSQQQNLKMRFVSDLRGYSSCKDCHQKQFEFWMTTSHSQSYKTLVKNSAEGNVECISCHVTQPPKSFIRADQGSTFLINLPEKLRVVGCESCHGPGHNHINDPATNKMKRKVTKNICMNCHTPERDDNFNYEDKREAIACPKSI